MVGTNATTPPLKVKLSNYRYRHRSQRLSCPEGTVPWYPKFCNSGYGALNFGHGAGLEARPLVCAARCVASWRTGMEPTEFERLKQALKLHKERGAITLHEFLEELSSLQVPQVSLQRQGATGAADSAAAADLLRMRQTPAAVTPSPQLLCLLNHRGRSGSSSDSQALQANQH